MKAEWFRKQWMRFRVRLTAALATIGVIVGGALYAQTVGFSYTPADAYTTGEPMPLSDIQFTRLYCDGALVAEEPGADSHIEADLGVGTHTCYGTHVAGGLESAPSNTVTRVVTLGPPNPPVIE